MFEELWAISAGDPPLGGNLAARPMDAIEPGAGDRTTGTERREASAAARRRIAHLLARYRTLRHRHESLLRQLRMAERVQRSLLPQVLPEVRGLCFGAGYRPLNHMAGDFYNAFRLDRDRVGFYVGDVMGHGPAAALLSVYAMNTLRTKRIEGQNYEVLAPAAVLAELSRTMLEAELPGEPFLTLAYGVLDLSRRTWTYCTGGHPAPMILRAGQAPEWLPMNGPLLGVLELPFHQDERELQGGDRLVLYTDGAMAAHWGSHGRGVEGLARWLDPVHGASAQAQIDAAIESARFMAPPDCDDITVLAVDVTS